jgi:hypothetical protein
VARYRESIYLGAVNEQFVAEELAKYMQLSGYSIASHAGQNFWKKETRHRLKPSSAPIRVYFAFQIMPDSVVIEAFVIWKIMLTIDSSEYGLERGLIGAAQKSVLKDQINQVRSFVLQLGTTS